MVCFVLNKILYDFQPEMGLYMEIILSNLKRILNTFFKWNFINLFFLTSSYIAKIIPVIVYSSKFL